MGNMYLLVIFKISIPIFVRIKIYAKVIKERELKYLFATKNKKGWRPSTDQARPSPQAKLLIHIDELLYNDVCKLPSFKKGEFELMGFENKFVIPISTIEKAHKLYDLYNIDDTFEKNVDYIVNDNNKYMTSMGYKKILKNIFKQ